MIQELMTDEANHLQKNLSVARFWSIIREFGSNPKTKNCCEIKASQDQISNINKETKKAYMTNPRAKELHCIILLHNCSSKNHDPIHDTEIRQNAIQTQDV